MTAQIDDDETLGLSRAIRTVEEQLLAMKEEMETLSRRVLAGEFEALKDSMKTTTEIRQWLRIATEMEAQVEKRRKEQHGIVREYALDFDAARHQIRCRLDRLRRCHGPAGVSGRVDGV